MISLLQNGSWPRRRTVVYGRGTADLVIEQRYRLPFVAARSSISELPPASRFWGPFWDHTSYATVNDPRFCERHAPARQRHKSSATWENALPLLPGGQVVAGSNPVSPTAEMASELRRWNCRS